MSDNVAVDVIFEKGTNRVVLVRYGTQWVLPIEWDLMHFENGVEPLIQENPDGYAYVHPSGCVINNMGSWLE